MVAGKVLAAMEIEFVQRAGSIAVWQAKRPGAAPAAVERGLFVGRGGGKKARVAITVRDDALEALKHALRGW